MCGIFVSLSDDNLSPDQQKLNKSSLDLLSHRGPDSSNFLNYERLFLGHTRLEVVDHDHNSNQPFTTLCQRYTIVFNGEIYNYRALARQYLSSFTFKTRSDTEVVAELWSELGPRCLDQLDGMFSLVILDRWKRTVTTARDMFGIKPLFFYSSGGFLIFSSEIRAILPHLPHVRANREIISHYLHYGLYDHTDYTFIQSILSVRPASVNTYSLDSSRFLGSYSFYDPTSLSPTRSSTHSPESILTELSELLRDCAISASVADVPTGANVSGGVDSSLLYYYLNTKSNKLPAFNVNFPSSLDAAYIDSFCLGFQYCRITIDQRTILEHLKDVVRHQTQPFGGIFVVAYSALYSSLREQGIRVSMDANGLDEMFLGYNKYLSADLIAQKSHHDGTIGILPNVLSRDMPSPDSLQYKPLNIDGFSLARNQALNDLFLEKVPRALRFNDHSSMQHSVELRVPFLRKSILEYSLTLPDAALMNSEFGKLPIRQILAQYTCNYQHAFSLKASIQTPQTQWLTNDLKRLVTSTVCNARFFDRGWVSPDVVIDALNGNLAIKHNNSFFIWQLVNLELFAQQFLDN